MPMELTLIPAPGRLGTVTFAFRPGGAGMSDDVAIVGLGIHPFGRHDGRHRPGDGRASPPARALADAGLGWEQIDFAAGGSDAARQRRHVGVGARPDRRPVHQRQERLRDRRLGADHRARDARRRQRRDRARGRLRQAPAGRVQPAARGVGDRLLVRRDRPDAHDAVLRDEDPALHGRARDQRVDAGQGRRARRSRTARATRTRGAASRCQRGGGAGLQDGQRPAAPVHVLLARRGRGRARARARRAGRASSRARPSTCARSRSARAASAPSRSSARRSRSSRRRRRRPRRPPPRSSRPASAPTTSTSRSSRTPSPAPRSCTSPRPGCASTASRRR